MPVRVLVVLCMLLPAAWTEEVHEVQFGEQFHEFYPTVVDAAAVMPVGLPQEVAVEVLSPARMWSATVERTDATRVAYDDELALLRIHGVGRPTTVIRVHGFRTVTVAWINDRLLHVQLDLGHVAMVDAIYDLNDRRWLYRDSLTY